MLSDVPDFDADVPVFDADDPERFHLLADLIEERLLVSDRSSALSQVGDDGIDVRGLRPGTGWQPPVS